MKPYNIDNPIDLSTNATMTFDNCLERKNLNNCGKDCIGETFGLNKLLSSISNEIQSVWADYFETSTLYFCDCPDIKDSMVDSVYQPRGCFFNIKKQQFNISL